MPAAPLDSGLGSSMDQLVICDVDLDAPCNMHPVASLEDTELLSLVTLGRFWLLLLLISRLRQTVFRASANPERKGLSHRLSAFDVCVWACVKKQHHSAPTRL